MRVVVDKKKKKTKKTKKPKEESFESGRQAGRQVLTRTGENVRSLQ